MIIIHHPSSLQSDEPIHERASQMTTDSPIEELPLVRGPFKINGISVHGKCVKVNSEREARIEWVAGTIETAFPSKDKLEDDLLWPGMAYIPQRLDILRRDARDAMRLAFERLYGADR